MRLLHTADWHLGQRFHDQRRGEDEAFALGALLDICRDHEVDAVLIAGDVFDTANPGAEEQRRYYRTLFDLVTKVGVATVVVTGGNHDSALRLDGPKDLLANLGIQVVGRWPRDAPAADCLVPIVDRQGETRAVCAAVPYLRDGDLRLPPVGETAPQIHARYAHALEARYGQAQDAAAELYPGLPLITMGHCYVDDGLVGGMERPVQVGNLAKVRASVLAEGAVYLALGHLHRPQALGGRETWRYCGSLLPTGFDEVERRREVVLFDLEDEQVVDVQAVPLPVYREYRRLEGDPDELRREIEALPEAPAAEPPSPAPSSPTPSSPTPWCEASVVLDGPRPGFAQDLMDRARLRGWNLISVKRRRDPDKERRRAELADVLELKELQPEEVFIERHRQEFGTEPDEELLADFRGLLQGLTSGKGGPTGDPKA